MLIKGREREGVKLFCAAEIIIINHFILNGCAISILFVRLHMDYATADRKTLSELDIKRIGGAVTYMVTELKGGL